MAVEATSRHKLACYYDSRSGFPAPCTCGSVLMAPPRPVPANPRTVLSPPARLATSIRRMLRLGARNHPAKHHAALAGSGACGHSAALSSYSLCRGRARHPGSFRETSDAHAPPRLAARRHRVQFGNSRPQRLCRRRQAPGRRRAAPSRSHAYPPAQADRPATAGSTAARPPTWAKPAGRASLQTGPQSEPWPAGPSPPRRTPRASCPCQEPLTASAFAAQR